MQGWEGGGGFLEQVEMLVRERQRSKGGACPLGCACLAFGRSVVLECLDTAGLIFFLFVPPCSRGIDGFTSCGFLFVCLLTRLYTCWHGFWMSLSFGVCSVFSERGGGVGRQLRQAGVRQAALGFSLCFWVTFRWGCSGFVL